MHVLGRPPEIMCTQLCLLPGMELVLTRCSYYQ